MYITKYVFCKLPELSASYLVIFAVVAEESFVLTYWLVCQKKISSPVSAELLPARLITKAFQAF